MLRSFLQMFVRHVCSILCLVIIFLLYRRAWYTGSGGGMFGQSREPDTVIDEPCAISTRVAPSFLRVGHVDLFARRAAGSPSAMRELEQIVEHALFREYPKIAERNEDLRDKAVAMLEEFPERLGQVVAGWLSTICFQQRCWSCAMCNYN